MIAFDHILTNSFADKNFKIAIFKSVFQTIFLFALLYHQQNLKQKKKLPLSLKEYIKLNQKMHLNKNCMKLIGLTLRPF